MQSRIKLSRHPATDEYTYKVIIAIAGILYWVYGLMPFVDLAFNAISVVAFVAVVILYCKSHPDFTKWFPLLIVLGGVFTIVSNPFRVVNVIALLYAVIETVLLIHCSPQKNETQLLQELTGISTVFLCLGGVIIVFSLLSGFLGYHSVYYYPAVTTTKLHLGRDLSSGALIGVLGNANIAANFYVIYLGFALFLLARNRKNLLLVLLTGADLLALYLTYSRGGYVGALVVLGTSLFLNLWKKAKRKNKSRLFILFIIFLICVVVAVVFLLGGVHIQLSGLGGRTDTQMKDNADVRILLWKAGLDSARSSTKIFLFGVGAEIKDAVRLYAHPRIEPALYNNMHNVYMQTLVGYGITGMLLFLIYSFTLLSRSVCAFFRCPEYPAEAAPVIGICLALVIINLVESDMYMKKAFEGTVFWICCGYLYGFSVLAGKRKNVCAR